MGSALFVCARNEIQGSRALIARVPLSRFDEVYELDGNSTDGTREFWESHGARAINHVRKGEIFPAACEATRMENIVFFAPDGNENPDDIDALLGKLEAGWDMAIASRFLKGARNEESERMFPLRLWANRAFSLVVRLLWGGTVSDSINGFRAVKRSRLIQLQLETTGFDIEFQTTIRGLKLGWKITEIPTYEGDRIGGKSSASSVRTGLLMLRRVFRELYIGTTFLRETERSFSE